MKRPSRKGRQNQPETASGARSGNSAKVVTVALVAATHGLHGWLKLDSGSPQVLLQCKNWLIRKAQNEWHPNEPSSCRDANGRILAKFKGVDSIEDAEALLGSQIGIKRGDLPELLAGENYWWDLIGLKVIGNDGKELGEISGLSSTQANDVLEVEGASGRILIPFVAKHILDIEKDKGIIKTNWLAEY